MTISSYNNIFHIKYNFHCKQYILSAGFIEITGNLQTNQFKGDFYEFPAYLRENNRIRAIFMYFMCQRVHYFTSLLSTYISSSILCTITSKINVSYPPKVSDCQKKIAAKMKFDRSNKFNLCYYEQVNPL